MPVALRRRCSRWHDAQARLQDLESVHAVLPLAPRGVARPLHDSCTITLDQDATVTAIVEVHPRLIVSPSNSRVSGGRGTFVADRDPLYLSGHDEKGSFVLELGESVTFTPVPYTGDATSDFHLRRLETDVASSNRFHGVHHQRRRRRWRMRRLRISDHPEVAHVAMGRALAIDGGRILVVFRNGLFGVIEPVQPR
jgi:hypothetical protein